ncbi:MAG: glycosyl hydrolase [Planctomycetota bacterium]
MQGRPQRQIAASGSLARFVVALLIAACVAAQAGAQGFSEKLGFAGGQADFINASGASWYYRWWHTVPNGVAGVNAEFIPQIRYVNGNFQNNLNAIAGLPNVDTLMVFNEPERADQSNVAVQTALDAWPQITQTLPNHRLILAGVSDDASGRAWLESFMNGADARNSNSDPSDDIRVDAVAFHWYGQQDTGNPEGAAQSFLNRVDWYHNEYNLPVWITEFAMHDWNNNDTDEAMLEANRRFLEAAIPGLESRSYVEKYSYYHWFDDARLFTEGPVTPDGPGEAYAGVLYAGETFDMNGVDQSHHVFYLNGGELKNDGAALGTAFRSLDVLGGQSRIGGQSDWALSTDAVVGNGSDLGNSFVNVRAGATLVKSGPNTVTFDGAALDISGDLRIDEGTLRLFDGRLNSGGAVTVGRDAVLETSFANGRGFYPVEGSTLAVRGEVRGPLSVTTGSVLEISSSEATIADDVIVTASTLRVGGVGFTEAGPAGTPVSTGLRLNFDAGADTPGDAEWTNTVNAATSVAFSGSASPVPVDSTELPALTQAYDISSVGGAEGLIGFYESGGPQRSQRDATFEAVFYVDPNNPDGKQIVFEAGGAGRGVAMLLDGSSLTFNVDGQGGDNDVVAELDPGWRHAIGVIDLDGAGDTLTLYIDGQPAGTLATSGIIDWAGGNPMGLGDAADSVTTGVDGGSADPFGGELALVRYYEGIAFSLAQVQQNYAALAPEPEPTVATIDGGLRLLSGSVVELDIAAGGLADKIVVGETIEWLGGSVEVSLHGGELPGLGEVFDLFDFAASSGPVDRVTLPTLPSALMWNTDLLGETGEVSVVLAGDYNGDGLVDAADFTVWRDTLGDAAAPQTGADGDGDGMITAADYEVWRSAFGQAAPGFGSAAVPEPTALLLVMGPLALCSRRRRTLNH